MEKTKNDGLKRYVVLMILSLGATAIYFLPYLRWTYYDTLKEALNLSNTQFGTLMSAYGLSSMVLYFPGGWLADRVSARKLLSFAFFFTGLAGFYFATYPSFVMLLVINIFWGALASLCFWAVLIKAVRQLAGGSEQGKFFGLLEGSRGLLTTVISMVVLAIFAKLGSNVYGLTWVINIYSGLNVAAAILTWFTLEDRKETIQSSDVVADILKIIKMKETWLISIVIFCVYGTFSATTYLTPYMTDIMGISVAMSGLLATIRIYVLQTLGGPVGGFVSDKVGSPSKIIKFSLIIVTICMAVFAMLPKNPAVLPIIIVNMLVIGILLFSVRGIYFSVLEEMKIPVVLTGAVVGFASMIGFTPDIFLNTLAGYLLDQHPGITGYKIFFAIVTGIAFVGFLAALALAKKVQQIRKVQEGSFNEHV